MNRDEIFRILEIDPTDDKRAIKKAYAKLVKQYHPEENPEKWKEIHDAYTEALKMTEQDSLVVSVPVSVSGVDSMKPEQQGTQQQVISEEDEELEVLFGRVKQLAAQHQEKEDIIQEEKFCRMLEELKALLEEKSFDREKWERLLKPDNMMMLTEREDFIYRFSFCFLHHNINTQMWSFLKKQLQEMSERYQNETETFQNDLGIQKAIDYAEQKIDSAHYSSFGKVAAKEAQRYKVKFHQVIIVVGVAIFAIMIVFVLYAAFFI